MFNFDIEVLGERARYAFIIWPGFLIKKIKNSLLRPWKAIDPRKLHKSTHVEFTRAEVVRRFTQRRARIVKAINESVEGAERIIRAKQRGH